MFNIGDVVSVIPGSSYSANLYNRHGPFRITKFNTGTSLVVTVPVNKPTTFDDRDNEWYFDSSEIQHHVRPKPTMAMELEERIGPEVAAVAIGALLDEIDEIDEDDEF